MDSGMKRNLTIVAVIAFAVGGVAGAMMLMGGASTVEDAAVVDMAYRHKSVGELQRMKHLAEQMIASGTLTDDQVVRQRAQIETLDAIIAEKLAERDASKP